MQMLKLTLDFSVANAKPVSETTLFFPLTCENKELSLFANQLRLSAARNRPTGNPRLVKSRKQSEQSSVRGTAVFRETAD